MHTLWYPFLHERFLRRRPSRALCIATIVCYASVYFGTVHFATVTQAQTPNADEREADAWSEVSLGERLFALQVQPALQAKCAACHGEKDDTIESGFVLNTREAILSGGDSGEAALVPGDREKSWLYLSATWEHDQLQMPPKENDRFDAETLEALGAWIDEGAPWPDADRVDAIRQQLDTGVVVATSGGLDAGWDQRRYEPESLWAYQPLQSTAVPAPTELPALNAIDAFLNQRLVESEIVPAGRADRRTLIRRLAFDLTGLPPTPAQVDAFLSDADPDEVAWEKLVDQWLASPQFGEQQARHWLDTVRYADSAGFANDYERPNTWRYRDYVVRRLSADHRIDEFIAEQIAGDELDPHDPEKLVATGMLRMGPWEQTGMSVDKVTRQLFLDDVTDVVGQAFLAHPLQCARCHDHKFDPIPTRDFYRIQAVFSTTQFAEREAPWVDAENQSDFAAQTTYLKRRINAYESVLKELNAKELAATKTWYAERGLEYATRAKKLKAGVAENDIAPRKVGFTAEDFGRERIARKYLERHRWELDRYQPLAFSVYSGPTPQRNGVSSRLSMPENLKTSGKLEQTAILTGGDPFSRGLAVTPGVFSALTGMLNSGDTRDASSVTTNTRGRRAEFAKWLTDASRNPLTPRVLVNRLWLHHFGQGLVATPNNFGTAGSRPTHPALLEWLAGEFVSNQWSSKHVHRLILTSHAYCRSQTSSDDEALRTKDPLGTSYAVFKARRLAAEELRDSVLAISGLLNSEMSGPPVRPDINAEVAAQPRQIMGTYAPIYQASPLPEDRNRRTLYALRLRGLRDPMLEIFNQPSPDLPCELRDSSTVATQALTLFNSPLAFTRALAMAQRLLHECANGADADVVGRAFELTYGRDASAEEIDSCLAHWRTMQLRHQSLQLSDSLPATEVTRTFVDENTGESFSYTESLEQNRDYEPELLPSQTDARIRGLAEVCLVLLSSNELLYVP